LITRSHEPLILTIAPTGGIRELADPKREGVILSEERAKRLSTQVQAIIPVFTHGKPLDIEWVLEGEQVWIVQARPFVGG
ncbi:MAG: PEP/pyruvate-binding domain-containing protein, partial [Kofleriaceae bacterium]